jgi:hypothetical protein
MGYSDAAVEDDECAPSPRGSFEQRATRRNHFAHCAGRRRHWMRVPAGVTCIGMAALGRPQATSQPRTQYDLALYDHALTSCERCRKSDRAIPDVLFPIATLRSAMP